MRTLTLAVILLSPTLAPAQTYVTIYAYQRGNSVSAAHSWAVFSAPGREITISWFPINDRVRLTGPSQPGKNMTHAESLAHARAVRATVTSFGPYRVHPELVERAARQELLLRSGAVQYKVLDRSVRPLACNCIHAVADIDHDAGFLVTGTARGAAASAMLARHLSRWFQ